MNNSVTNLEELRDLIKQYKIDEMEYCFFRNDLEPFTLQDYMLSKGRILAYDEILELIYQSNRDD